MNANELVARLKNKIMHEYRGGTNFITEITASERDDIIRELSRARIRETATEPPTREDGRGCLCALDDMNCWNFKKWYEISDCPSTYILWFIMPDVRLPEVTP